MIGTLYCCKGNFAFGLSRVLRSLDPLPSKLSVDTWHYAKRCIVALLDHMTKQMVALKVRHAWLMTVRDGCTGRVVAGAAGVSDRGGGVWQGAGVVHGSRDAQQRPHCSHGGAHDSRGVAATALRGPDQRRLARALQHQELCRNQYKTRAEYTAHNTHGLRAP